MTGYRRRPDPGARAEPGHLLPAPVLPAIRRLRHADQRARRGRPVRPPPRRRAGPGQQTRKEGDADRSRGVHLSSETLGLSGVLDVIEEKDGDVLPGRDQARLRPARRRRPADDLGQRRRAALRPGAADGRGVRQAGGARLPVLRRHAASASRCRFTDELRTKTRAAIDAVPPAVGPGRAAGAAAGRAAAPLLRLLAGPGLPAGGDALPDRPARRRRGDEPPPAGLTRVIPQSDDGAVLYVQEPGSHVGKRSEHLVVRKDGQELTRVPMHAVRQVVVFGNVQVSTQALETLVANEIPVAYLTGYGRFIGPFAPAPAKNVGLREAQFRRFADPAECLTLAKAVVRAKLTNQRTLLMRTPARRRRPRQRRAGRPRPGRPAADSWTRRRRWRRCWGWRARGRRCTSASSAGS